MVILGHQFRGSVESEWMMKTSIRYDVGGNTKKILQEVFKENNARQEEKLNTTKEDKSPPFPHSSSRSDHVKPLNKIYDGADDVDRNKKSVRSARKKKDCGYIFENFDESQHLNGCPLKWLYYKKLSEGNAAYRVRRTFPKKSDKREDIKKFNNSNVRDKTPVEVKIHKINLMERSDVSNWKMYPIEEANVQREIETKRKNLAAKLNWKLHDDTPNDSEQETSSQLSSRNNYFLPRPFWGLKPLLSILLLPHQETNCCPLKVQIQPSSKKEEPMESPSLSIKSLELPQVKILGESPSRINSRGRWGSKLNLSEKKLQIPNQVTINLRRKQIKSRAESYNKTNVSKVSNESLKKLSGRAKQTKPRKSLSSLFYELSYKMNYKNENNEYFEDLIRDLTVEDEDFKFQRFFQFHSSKRNSGIPQKEKFSDEKQKKQTNDATAADGSAENINFRCSKARFFKRFGEPKTPK